MCFERYFELYQRFLNGRLKQEELNHEFGQQHKYNYIEEGAANKFQQRFAKVINTKVKPITVRLNDATVTNAQDSII